MASGGSSLNSFVIRQKDLFFRRKVQPEKAVDALAEAFIEDLRREVPGPDAHPNATGNMLDALTTRSGVTTTGYVTWVGVGDMSRLGKPGEKRYKPRPIKRFLDWYLEREEERHEERRKRQRQLAAERAARARQREAARKQRIAAEGRADWARYVENQISSTERLIASLEREVEKLEYRYSMLSVYATNYSIYFQRGERRWFDPESGRWRGYDLSKKSYQVKQRKWDNITERQRKLRERITRIESRIRVYTEGVEKFRQRWQ